MNLTKLSWEELSVLYKNPDMEIYTAVCCEVMRRVVGKFEPEDRDYEGAAKIITAFIDKNGTLEKLADKASNGNQKLKNKWLDDMKKDGVYIESPEGNFQKSSDEFFHMASNR